MKKRISLLIAMIMALALIAVAFAAMPASAATVARATETATADTVIATVYANTNDDRATATKVEEITLANINLNNADGAFTDRNNGKTNNLTAALAGEGKYIWVEFNKYIINFEKSPGSSHGMSFYVADGKTLYINGNGAVFNYTGANAGGRAMSLEAVSDPTTGNGKVVISNLDLINKTSDACIQMYHVDLELNDVKLDTKDKHTGIVANQGGTVNLVSSTVVGKNAFTGAAIKLSAMDSSITGPVKNSQITLEPAAGNTEFKINTSLTVAGDVIVGDASITSARTVNIVGGLIVSEAKTVTVNSGVTLTSSSTDNSTVQFTNGKNPSKLEVKTGATVTTTSTGTWIPAVRGYNGTTILVSGGTIRNDSASSAKVAILAYEGTKIQVTSGKITSASGNFTVGLYKNSQIAVSGGIVENTGSSGAIGFKGATSGGAGVVTVTGGELKAPSIFYLESGALANVTVSGGSLNGSVGTQITLSGTVGGNFTLKKGTYDIGEGTTFGGTLVIDGATVNMTGGTVETGTTVNSGTLNISGTAQLKNGGSNALTINGGTVNMTGGTVTSGGGSNTFAVYGAATVTVTGGTISNTGSGNAVRAIAAATGNVSFSGCTISGQKMEIANATTTISNATLAVAINGSPAISGTIGGNVTFASGTPTLASGTTFTGSVTIAGATVDMAGTTVEAGTTVSSGTLNISGTAQLKNGGSNALTINGGTVNMTGGTVTSGYGSNTFAVYGAATVTVTGGTISNTGSGNAIRVIAEATGDVSFSGCTISGQKMEIANATTTISDATVSGAINGNPTLSGTISGAVTFKTGTVAGNFTLGTGTHTVDGATLSGSVTVDGAVLNLVSGTISDGVTVKGGSAEAPAFKITGGTLDKSAGDSWREALAVYGYAEIAGGTVTSDNCPLHIYTGGTVTMTGGTVKTRANNNAAGIDGTFNISGGEVKSTGSRAIAARAGGIVNISGGHVDSIDLDGANSALTMTGGTVGSIKVNNASATLTLTNATVTKGINVVKTDNVITIRNSQISSSGLALNLYNNTSSLVRAYNTTFKSTGGSAIKVGYKNKLETENCNIISEKTGAEAPAILMCDITTTTEGGKTVFLGYANIVGGKIENNGNGNQGTVLVYRYANMTLTGVEIVSKAISPAVSTFSQGNPIKLVINNCTISGSSTDKTLFALSDSALDLEINDSVIVAEKQVAINASAAKIVINNSKIIGNYDSRGAIRLTGNATITLNNCDVRNTNNKGYALEGQSGKSGNKVTINGGTYTANGRPVVRIYSSASHLDLINGVSIYSTGDWSDAFWAFGTEGDTTGTRNSWTAFVRSPKGVNAQITGGQFDIKNAECSVVIGGTTYYVYTGAKGGVPTTIDGASVRIEGEDAGIRFTSYISKKTIDAAEAAKREGTTVEYGTAIFPTALIEAAGLDTFDPLALEAKGYTVAWVKTVEGQTAVKNANDEIVGYTVRGALVGIKEDHLDWQYSAIAYIKYTNADGEVVYTFGNYDKAQNSRSVLQVADAALKDLSDTRAGKYIYKVADGETVKWSPYTAVQRGVLEAYFAE